MTKPTAYTADELRHAFIEHVADNAKYWAGLDDKTPLERCNGLAFTILSTLDGSSPALPRFKLIAAPADEDKEFLRSEGQRWIEPETDIGDGGLHERFHDIANGSAGRSALLRDAVAFFMAAMGESPPAPDADAASAAPDADATLVRLRARRAAIDAERQGIGRDIRNTRKAIAKQRQEAKEALRPKKKIPMKETMAKADARYRKAFEMKKKDMTFRELGALMGVSAGIARYLFTRGERRSRRYGK